MKAFSLFWILSVLSFALNAQGIDGWLQKMKHAMMTSNYEGVLVIRQNDQMQTLRVKHGLNKQGMWETLDSMNGEARKIMRAKGKVTTVFPERQLLTISRYSLSSPMHPQLPDDHKTLDDYYDIKLAGEDRIANKLAQIVDVIPKDKFRYGFRFWLEKNTGLLLKCDLKNADGKIVEQLMYSSLNILSQPPKRTELAVDEKYKVINIDAQRINLPASPILIKELPEGFKMIQASRQPSSMAQGDVYHIVYSDGMASVSVFIEQNQAGKAAYDGSSKMGAVNVISKPFKQHQLTVMGEVPVETVKAISQSVSFVIHD